MGDSATTSNRLRWWPAAVVGATGALALTWVWLSDGGRTGQGRVLMSIQIALFSFVLLVIWLVFFSRLSRSRRRIAAALVLAVLGLVAATTRIRGVTGD